MQLTVDGGKGPVTIELVNGSPITINLGVNMAGERMPKVRVNAMGGILNCYASDVTKTGNIALHLFGDAEF